MPEGGELPFQTETYSDELDTFCVVANRFPLTYNYIIQTVTSLQMSPVGLRPNRDRVRRKERVETLERQRHCC